MSNLLSSSKFFVKRNGSTILTVAGGIGAVATTVMAVKATPKALKTIEAAEEVKGEKLTKTEIVQVAGPIYIPTAIVGVGTLACIFGANILNKRQQASLISAYTLLDGAYKEYRNKVDQLYGSEADNRIREEIAKDNYKEPVKIEYEQTLFYDFYSKRFFEATMLDVVQAEADLNRMIAEQGGAFLNEYYDLLNLEPTTEGKELGWSLGILESMYWANWVDFDHKKAEMEDGTEYYIISMMQEPVIDFAYY